MSLQIECSDREKVTVRAAKRLQDCINVAHVVYVVVVSWQSHSIFVFLHASASKISDNVPIHNIYIKQQNVDSEQIFNNSNIVQVDSLELHGAQFILFIKEQIEKNWSFFFQSLSACKWKAIARKRHKWSLNGFVVFCSYLRQMTVPFFNRGSSKTAFLHPKRTSLRRTANTVKFVNL